MAMPSLFLVQHEVPSRSSASTCRCLSSLAWLKRSRTFLFAESIYLLLEMMLNSGFVEVSGRERLTDHGACLSGMAEMGDEGGAINGVGHESFLPSFFLLW